MKFAASVVALLVAPAVALNGGYLSQMGGGNAMKASSFMPTGGVVSAPAGPASYLDNISPTAPVANDFEASPAVNAPAFSFSEMVDDSAVAASAGDYLTALKVSSATEGTGPVGYLDALRIQASENAATNLPGYLDTLCVQASTVTGGTGPLTYLDNLMGAAAVTAKVEATTEVTMVDEEPVLAAINQLAENMNRNHEQTLGILQDINTSVQTLVSKGLAFAPAADTPAYTQAHEQPARLDERTELVSALEASTAPAPTTSSYLEEMNGAAAFVSAGPSGSYAPTKSNVAYKSAGSGFGSYLDSF